MKNSSETQIYIKGPAAIKQFAQIQNLEVHSFIWRYENLITSNLTITQYVIKQARGYVLSGVLNKLQQPEQHLNASTLRRFCI